MPSPRRKNETGIRPVLPRHSRDRPMRDLVERAVQLRLREEQRDAGQRQEQLDRKPGEDVIEPHPAEIDADDPGEGDRQHAEFSRVKQLTTMATNRAPSESHARDMGSHGTSEKSEVRSGK